MTSENEVIVGPVRWPRNLAAEITGTSDPQVRAWATTSHCTIADAGRAAR